jgi:hypothetical protein
MYQKEISLITKGVTRSKEEQKESTKKAKLKYKGL